MGMFIRVMLKEGNVAVSINPDAIRMIEADGLPGPAIHGVVTPVGSKITFMDGKEMLVHETMGFFDRH
jgi:hypothetical protein